MRTKIQKHHGDNTNEDNVLKKKNISPENARPRLPHSGPWRCKRKPDKEWSQERRKEGRKEEERKKAGCKEKEEEREGTRETNSKQKRRKRWEKTPCQALETVIHEDHLS